MLHPPVSAKRHKQLTGPSLDLMFHSTRNQAIKQTNVHTYMHLPVYILTHHASTIQPCCMVINHYTDTTSTSSTAIKQHRCPVLVACHQTRQPCCMTNDCHIHHINGRRYEEVADLPSSSTRNSHLTTMSLLDISQQNVSTAATTRTSALVGQAHD